MIRDLRSLRRATKQWQSKLRLKDWDITVKWGSHDTIPESWGECLIDGNTRTATIWIMPPNLVPPESEDHVEDTLVHEMLHILLHPMNPECSEIIEEQIIRTLVPLIIKETT